MQVNKSYKSSESSELTKQLLISLFASRLYICSVE